MIRLHPDRTTTTGTATTLQPHSLIRHPRSNATAYYAAAAKIATAVNSLLLVKQGSTAYFIEGVGDDVRALDTEALGIMFLQSQGQTSTAGQVLAYTRSAMAVSGRSITTSSDASTYNMTYSAKGPLSGFEP